MHDETIPSILPHYEPRVRPQPHSNNLVFKIFLAACVLFAVVVFFIRRQ